MSTSATPGFRITSGKGFHITFANGWTVSVQFGPGNYCEHYDESFRAELPRKCESYDAEVAAWGPETDNALISFGGNTVKGWVSPAYVLALLNAAANGDLARGVLPPDDEETT